MSYDNPLSVGIFLVERNRTVWMNERTLTGVMTSSRKQGKYIGKWGKLAIFLFIHLGLFDINVNHERIKFWFDLFICFVCHIRFVNSRSLHVRLGHCVLIWKFYMLIIVTVVFMVFLHAKIFSLFLCGKKNKPRWRIIALVTKVMASLRNVWHRTARCGTAPSHWEIHVIIVGGWKDKIFKSFLLFYRKSSFYIPCVLPICVCGRFIYFGQSFEPIRPYPCHTKPHSISVTLNWQLCNWFSSTIDHIVCSAKKNRGFVNEWTNES